MIVIEKDSYTIDEAMEEINNEGIEATRSDINHLGDEGLLKFHIKLGYRTAIAIQNTYEDKEKKKVKDISFIGICNISGLAIVLPTDFTALLHKEEHEIHSIAGTKFCKKIIISNWRTNIPYDIQLTVPQVAKIWKPIEYNGPPVIDAFLFKPKYGIQSNSNSIEECIPISNLTPQQLNNYKKFGSGILRQFNFNCVFDKSNLCILKDDLNRTIRHLKQKSKTSNNNKTIKKLDHRKNDATDALRDYIHFIFKSTKKGWTEFTNMLESDYSKESPYNNTEYKEVTNVYIEKNKLYYKYKTPKGSQESVYRSIFTLKKYFTLAKE